MKNHLLRAYYRIDWSVCISLIKSEILIAMGMDWPVCSDKWKAPWDVSLRASKKINTLQTRDRTNVEELTNCTFPLVVWSQWIFYCYVPSKMTFVPNLLTSKLQRAHWGQQVHHSIILFKQYLDWWIMSLIYCVILIIDFDDIVFLIIMIFFISGPFPAVVQLCLCFSLFFTYPSKYIIKVSK